MREEEKESWEEEFDKKFHSCHPWEDDETIIFLEDDNTYGTLEMIKEFIREALASQRAELLEKIEKFSEGIGCEKNPRWVLSEVKKIIGGSDE